MSTNPPTTTSQATNDATHALTSNSKSNTRSHSPDSEVGNRGRGKRVKRDSQKKREAKTEDTKPGKPQQTTVPAREKKKLATSASSNAVPPSELGIMMPIALADPRPTDVLHPRARHMSFVSEKYSDVLGQSRRFFEITDKYVTNGPLLGVKLLTCVADSTTETGTDTLMLSKTLPFRTFVIALLRRRPIMLDSASKIRRWLCTSPRMA